MIGVKEGTTMVMTPWKFSEKETMKMIGIAVVGELRIFQYFNNPNQSYKSDLEDKFFSSPIDHDWMKILRNLGAIRTIQTRNSPLILIQMNIITKIKYEREMTV